MAEGDLESPFSFISSVLYNIYITFRTYEENELGRCRVLQQGRRGTESGGGGGAAGTLEIGCKAATQLQQPSTVVLAHAMRLWVQKAD